MHNFTEYADASVENLQKSKVVNKIKIVLKSCGSVGQHMEIVIKKSERKQNQLFFAVFTKAKDSWMCQEKGYMSDGKWLKEYIDQKYINFKND